MFGIPFLIRSSCHGGEQCIPKEGCCVTQVAPVIEKRPYGVCRLCAGPRLTTSSVPTLVTFSARLSPQGFQWMIDGMEDDQWLVRWIWLKWRRVARRRPHSLVCNHLDPMARQMSGPLEMKTDAVDDQDVLNVPCLAPDIPQSLLCPPSFPLNHDSFLRRFYPCAVFSCVIGRQDLNQRWFETRQRFV